MYFMPLFYGLAEILYSECELQFASLLPTNEAASRNNLARRFFECISDSIN